MFPGAGEEGTCRFWGAEVSWAVLGEELQCPQGGEAMCGNGLGVASLQVEVSQS